MKYLVTVLALGIMSGCGAFDRMKAKFTGDAVEVCMQGVIYYQFTSGSAVAYNPDGSLKTCKD